MDSGDVIAALALGVSGALAALRTYEFVQAHKRVSFQITYSTLVSGDPSRTERPSFLTIHVGNRWTLPMQVTTIGFYLKKGTGLLFTQIEALHMLQQRLPTTLAPTEGFTLGIRPDKLYEAVKDDGGSKAITSVYCFDASGRGYKRKVTKRELEQIDKAFADVEDMERAFPVSN